MHQDPEHEDYEEDDYNNDYYSYNNEYDYPENSNKFAIDWSAWESWLAKAMKDIVEENGSVWSFGHTNKKAENHNPKIFSDKHFVYLGNNSYDESIWKAKYFVSEPLYIQYKNHLSCHAAHFVRQPLYYRGMFDIMN